MDQAEDFGARTALVECAYDVRVRNHIGCEFARFDIEYEDEDCDGAEDMIA